MQKIKVKMQAQVEVIKKAIRDLLMPQNTAEQTGQKVTKIEQYLDELGENLESFKHLGEQRPKIGTIHGKN